MDDATTTTENTMNEATAAKIARLEEQLAGLRHFIAHGLEEHPSAAVGLTEIEVEQLAIQVAQSERFVAKYESKIAKLRAA